MSAAHHQAFSQNLLTRRLHAVCTPRPSASPLRSISLALRLSLTFGELTAIPVCRQTQPGSPLCWTHCYHQLVTFHPPTEIGVFVLCYATVRRDKTRTVAPTCSPDVRRTRGHSNSDRKSTEAVAAVACQSPAVAVSANLAPHSDHRPAFNHPLHAT